MDSGEALNRRQRRAAAKTSRNTSRVTGDGANIKLSQPDRSGPKGKTLFQLAEEREALLSQGTPFLKTQDSIASDADTQNNAPAGPFGDAVVYSFSLSMLNFTLSVLVYNQYMQSIEWVTIVQRVGSMLPVLFLLIYMLHTAAASRFPRLRQLFFFTTAICSGCYMVQAANNYGYFAVMKRAPPVGTLWIWSVIELNLPFALASVFLVGVYMWHGGYTIF